MFRSFIFLICIVMSVTGMAQNAARTGNRKDPSVYENLQTRLDRVKEYAEMKKRIQELENEVKTLQHSLEEKEREIAEVRKKSVKKDELLESIVAEMKDQQTGKECSVEENSKEHALPEIQAADFSEPSIFPETKPVEQVSVSPSEDQPGTASMQFPLMLSREYINYRKNVSRDWDQLVNVLTVCGTIPENWTEVKVD